MWNWHREQLMAQARHAELLHEAQRQRCIREALTGSRAGKTRALGRLVRRRRQVLEYLSSYRLAGSQRP